MEADENVKAKESLNQQGIVSAFASQPISGSCQAVWPDKSIVSEFDMTELSNCGETRLH